MPNQKGKKVRQAAEKSQGSILLVQLPDITQAPTKVHRALRLLGAYPGAQPRAQVPAKLLLHVRTVALDGSRGVGSPQLFPEEKGINWHKVSEKAALRRWRKNMQEAQKR